MNNHRRSSSSRHIPKCVKGGALVRRFGCGRSWFYTVAVLVTLLLVSAGSGWADGLSLASFSFEYIPSAELNISGNEGQELDNIARTYTAKLAIPVLLSGKKTVLLNFLTFRILNQDFGNIGANPNVFQPLNLYSFKYGLVFHQVLSDHWTFATLIQPALQSDLINVNRDHIVLRAGFLFERKASAKVKYGFGLGYSDDYGNARVLPVVRFRWKPSDMWRFKFDVPSKLEVFYRLGQSVQVGIDAKVTGGHFRIGENFVLGNGTSIKNGRVKYSTVNVGPAAKFALYKGTSLTLVVGNSVYRRFEVFDAGGLQIEDSNFEMSFFFKAKIEFEVGTG